MFLAQLFTGSPEAARATAERAVAELPPDDADFAPHLEALALSTYFFGGGGDRAARPHGAPPGAPREPGPGAKMLAGVAAYDWINRGGGATECSELTLAALDGTELLETGNGLIIIITTVTLVLADRPEAIAALEALAATPPSWLPSTSARCTSGSATRTGPAATSRRPSR